MSFEMLNFGAFFAIIMEVLPLEETLIESSIGETRYMKREILQQMGLCRRGKFSEGRVSVRLGMVENLFLCFASHQRFSARLKFEPTPSVVHELLVDLRNFSFS